MEKIHQLHKSPKFSYLLLYFYKIKWAIGLEYDYENCLSLREINDKILILIGFKLYNLIKLKVFLKSDRS